MPTLNERIARFYDDTSPLWLDVWGDHMHHGYYGPDGADTGKPRREAQLDLIEELIDFARLDERVPYRVLDAGCGVGGSARYLAGRYGARALGLTLSAYQAAEGNARAKDEGCDHLVELRAQDVYTLTGQAGEFDLVWSLESAEHMPDKRALMTHFYELLRPGGTLAMVTWCRRATPPALTDEEQRQLDNIAELYHLPPWVPVSDYVSAAEDLGFEDIRTDDWSAAVAPFWGEVIKSALQPSNLFGLLKSGASGVKGAWAMQYMRGGFKSGLIEYAVLTARKPVPVKSPTPAPKTKRKAAAKPKAAARSAAKPKPAAKTKPATKSKTRPAKKDAGGTKPEAKN